MVRRLRHPEAMLAGAADVKWCYRLLLGREPEGRGRRGFVSLVTDNAVPRSELVSLFLSSPEFRDRLNTAYGWTDGTLIGTRIDDLTIYVDSGDTAIGSFLRKSGHYEPDVTEIVRRYLQPGESFVDVGASFGYFSALAGNIVGSAGSVVAVEPGPQNQSLLLLNLLANGVSTGEVHQVALSDAAGIYRYGRSGANGTISVFDGDPESLGTYDLVRAMTFDSLIGERQVDMIKIDVEGAEGRVLRGAEATLLRCGPTIVFEFSPPSLEVTSQMSGREVLDDLSRLGYSFDLVEPGRERAGRLVGEILQIFDDTDGDHVNLLAWRS